MLSRLRYARSIVWKWMPSSTPVLFDNSTRSVKTKTPATTSPDFFQKYMDVDNMVRRTFMEIENKYQQFFDSQKDIEIPLDGDDSKIKKYHAQITKLRKQNGLPDKVDVMEMLMKEKKAWSKGSVRKWVKDLENVWGEALFESMMSIVAAVEKNTGKQLSFPTKEDSAPEGWKQFINKYDALMKEYGLDKPMTKDEILYEDTKEGLNHIVENAQKSMDEACERLGIAEKFNARELRTTITRDIE